MTCSLINEHQPLKGTEQVNIITPDIYFTLFESRPGYEGFLQNLQVGLVYPNMHQFSPSEFLPT